MSPFSMIRQPIERSRRDLTIEADASIWSDLESFGSEINKTKTKRKAESQENLISKTRGPEDGHIELRS